jgi:hypothetical protein
MLVSGIAATYLEDGYSLEPMGAQPMRNIGQAIEVYQ